MTRTETDLRAALHDLEQRADEHGAPSTATILGAVTTSRPEPGRPAGGHRFPRRLAPVAAAGVVAATAITALTLSSQGGGSGHAHRPQAGSPRVGPTPAASTSSHAVPPPTPAPLPATILDDAAARLDTAPWSAPAPDQFFYVRTTDATSWTSVSGRQEGDVRTAGGAKISVPACVHGQIVSVGESGPCTLNDVPHYRADAPTTPAAWDAYLERMAPGAKAAGAQGKIIVQVLHQDLVAPKAAAALLRYTADCPGLHFVAVRPLGGRQLTGITCTSMTNGSYGLAFDAGTHAFAGFVGVDQQGQADGPAELVLKTGIVDAVYQTP